MRTQKFHWNAFLSITALGVLCCLMPCFGQNAVILPKPPVSINDYIPEAQKIAPMPLAERLKREVVPARGLVSIAPGVGKNDLLKSGNGKMNIDVFRESDFRCRYFQARTVTVCHGKHRLKRLKSPAHFLK